MSLYHLTEMNVYALQLDGNVTFSYKLHALPTFLMEIQEDAFSHLCTAIPEHADKCCLYSLRNGLTYAAGAYEKDHPEASVFIIGPFLRQMPDVNQILSLNSEQDRMILNEFLRSLPLLKKSKLQTILNFLHQVRIVKQVPLHFIKESLEINHAEKPVSPEADMEPSREIIDLRYEVSNRMIEAVKDGDKQALQAILNQSGNIFDFSERFPNQPVRTSKNSLIILNTTLRLAAEKGGVPPVYLHHLSEKFAIQIERINSIDAFNTLIRRMGDEYCDLVRDFSMSGYSFLIQKAMNYLAGDYKKPFNLQRLADECLVHPSHLSRQFKKETGMTLTHYLHQIRIEKAKWLLRNDQSSIEWVAGAVGFEDAGYFTRQFKKHTGMTPSQFRNNTPES